MILPTNSSLSVTLSQDDLRSLTSARCITAAGQGSGEDRLWLNGHEEEINPDGRTHRCLAELRHLRKALEVRRPLSLFESGRGILTPRDVFAPSPATPRCPN